MLSTQTPCMGRSEAPSHGRLPAAPELMLDGSLLLVVVVDFPEVGVIVLTAAGRALAGVGAGAGAGLTLLGGAIYAVTAVIEKRQKKN